eukprot:10753605-Alexandrium_andersonii.AAC.1
MIPIGHEGRLTVRSRRTKAGRLEDILESRPWPLGDLDGRCKAEPGPSDSPVSYTHLTLPTICSVDL